LIIPSEKRNTLVPSEVTRVKHPLRSGPTEYELLAAVTGTFVCKPPDAALLMSSTPAVIFPVPSAVNDASIPTGPLASNPVNDMAYCPFRSDSLPVPHAVAVVIVRLKGCVAVSGVGELESVNCAVKLVVPTSEAVAVPAIVPVLGSRVKPAGSVPGGTLHVTGNVPPVDCSVWW
jgi:hypothetical protein